jgi:DNA-binding response OmpR family regulator
MEKILVYHLEDDVALRNIIGLQITHLTQGVELVQFTTGDEIMAALEQELLPIDLFLLDVRVPGELNGNDVAVKARQMGYDCPIIITSAFTAPPAKWLKEWRCDWMVKPTHALDLQQKVIPHARNYHTQARKQTS